MLESLYVKDLAIVDEVRVSFGKGLNIITGETGAGKSVIIGSVNLALGAKANKNLIRRGKDFAFAELVFSVDAEMEARLKDIDVFAEEGIVTIARRIGADKSISRINGETVTLAKAREVSSMLLDLHGQQENHSLLSSKNHLEILDRYCIKEVADLKIQIEEGVKQYKKKMEELESYNRDKISAERELDFFNYECHEIEAAKLIPGEEEELEERVRKYSYSGRIIDHLNEADEYIFGRNGAEEFVSKSVRLLSKLADMDKGAEELYEELSNIEALLSDFKSSLSDYAEGNVFDEEDFRKSEQRLDLIRGIYAKHGGSYLSTTAFFEEAKETIDRLTNFSAYKEALRQETAALKEEIIKACDLLSEKRKRAAKKFSAGVKKALKDLNFLQVEFEVEFKKQEMFNTKGMDEVTYLISTNPGEPLRNIAEIASGGELSRIMLAIKSVMADTDSIPTLIFDEIDTGISGRTAQMVSEKLALLSSKRQLIAITHLAQIAAMADEHFLIEKNSDESHTATEVKKLSEKESIKELARILGGAAITENVLSSAAEMKKLATASKENRKTH